MKITTMIFKFRFGDFAYWFGLSRKWHWGRFSGWADSTIEYQALGLGPLLFFIGRKYR